MPAAVMISDANFDDFANSARYSGSCLFLHVFVSCKLTGTGFRPISDLIVSSDTRNMSVISYG
jgi:hypothetical protein